MIRQLQRHLTFLFTAATGAILTLILCIIFIFLIRSNDSQAEAYFHNQLLDLTNKLETDTTFSDNWLSKTEAAGRLIIHIEENEMPLFFSGTWDPLTDRNTLIKRAQKQAAKLGVFAAHRPFSTSLAKSGVFLMEGNANDRYRAYVLTVSYQDSFRSLTLLQDTTLFTQNKLWQALFFLALDLCGIFALYLISRLTIKNTLAPVAESQIRQTEFVASASHELRSPLAVIQASASAITALPERAPEMALAIQQECIRAGNLVKDLLALASIDSDSFSVPQNTFEADRLLLRLYEAYEPR